MASVTLTHLWLHDANDNSDSLKLRLSGEVEDFEQPSEVRRYAGGRLRVVTRAGTQQRVAVEVMDVSREDLADLQGRVAKVQMLREPRGRKFWGVISLLRVEEWAGNGNALLVTFTFTEVSFDEAV